MILQQQRFAGWTKHGIPAQAAKVSTTDSMSATRRHIAVQSKSGRTDGSQQKEKCRTLNPTFHEVAFNIFCQVSGALETGAYSKPELHKNKCFFKPGRLWKNRRALPLVT